NGQPTTSTGERRQYTSKNLQLGSVYAYRVRAEYVRDGKPISEEKSIELTAGQTASLAFKSAAPNAQLADMAKSAQR
ncbi:MAG TPA: TIGR03000 domain-containing protein, partial [Pirellulales bacterium]